MANDARAGEDAFLPAHVLAGIDKELSPLLAIAQDAINAGCRIPVLSPWRFIRHVPLFASHLHLRWPGRLSSFPLSPRIGIYPSFGEQEQFSTRLYSVPEVRRATRAARTQMAVTASSAPNPYPDWEQAIDRNPDLLGQLLLPALSFISIDRVTSAGEIKAGHRKLLGRFTPRNQFRPQILVPARSDITRQQIRAFENLDLLLVNIQNVGGRRLAEAISFFLMGIPSSVPTLIIASSPAEFSAINLGIDSNERIQVLASDRQPPAVEVQTVGRDRAQVDRQFSFSMEGLKDRSSLLAQMTAQAQRTWWAIRQSLSEDEPREAEMFLALARDCMARSHGQGELELLNECLRLIVSESRNAEGRRERREAILAAALHDEGQTQLLIVRSDAAAAELRAYISKQLDLDPLQLGQLGIRVQSVFSRWPEQPFERCVSCGYFGNKSLDAMFASGAQRALLIADPVEARVALWDIENKYRSVPHLPPALELKLASLADRLQAAAAMFADAISLGSLFGEYATRPRAQGPTREHLEQARQIIVFFTDGSNAELSVNARMEVLGRQHLRLRTVVAKDLQIGDRVVLLNEDERDAFSERLLGVLDQTIFSADSGRRRQWLHLLQAINAQLPISATKVQKGLSLLSFDIDLPTIRSWIPKRGVDDSGVPEREDVFIAFAGTLGLTLGNELLLDWFDVIERLRKQHRIVGRDLVRAIRGAYLGRLDPVTVAKMEKEWGMEAKMLLEAARVAVVDELIAVGTDGGND